MKGFRFGFKVKIPTYLLIVTMWPERKIKSERETESKRGTQRETVFIKMNVGILRTQHVFVTIFYYTYLNKRFQNSKSSVKSICIV